ncbi:MAG: cytochrome c [Acidobacteria bacterium]|nr:cytochrome c [Acidobacteriota bacterium]
MRKLVLAVVVVFLAVTPMLLAQKGDAAAGKAIYTSKCAMCHGAAGEGKEAMAKMLKVEFKHLGSKEVQAKSDADLKKEIGEGVGKMKPVKLASDADVANVIAYMRTLKK